MAFKIDCFGHYRCQYQCHRRYDCRCRCHWHWHHYCKGIFIVKVTVTFVANITNVVLDWVLVYVGILVFVLLLVLPLPPTPTPPHRHPHSPLLVPIPMRTFTYLQKVFTLNVTIPSVIATDISNRSVISVHSCWKWNILHWPECMSNNSPSPLKRARGRLIFAGSKSVISCEHEMWRTGPNKIPTLPSVLGASCTCDPEGTTNIYDTDLR